MEDKQSNLNTIIGMVLIFVLVYFWMQYAAPPEKPAQDQTPAQTTKPADKPNSPAAAAPIAAPAGPDSAAQQTALTSRFGVFAPAASGTEQLVSLENDLLRVTFTSKGARIKEVFLKNYYKINLDSAGDDVKSPLRLLEDAKNRFEYLIPAAGAPERISSSDLYFSATKDGNNLVFRAPASTGGYFEQTYTLSADNYELSHTVGGQGLLSALAPGQNALKLNWVNNLDKLERNQEYERTMSTVYFKADNGDPDYCDCRANDSENLGEQPVKWFSHSNQFFNTSIIARDFAFREFVGETVVLTNADPDLKIVRASALVPLKDGKAGMTIYTGPNEFDRLRKYDVALEDIIPFGSSMFGAINRWIVHPIFEFLSKFIGSAGIVILLLTLIVKLLLYPLTYRMVYSQAKMAALKPKIEELRKKHEGDQQAMSVETMKMYSEHKVNPLGGCLPIVLQMPIWFALYRFFPAAIEFRQASFLWATDLSSYDVAVKLPFYVMGFGTHLSAFTLIWVVTTLWYTWYSMKQMDTSAMAGGSDQMKIMKYMQYGMPVMFMFFFNSFAAGLTLYLCFSNILNIGQTVVTKQFFIDQDKIKAQLEANKNSPKKKGGFSERLQAAMREQQRVQEEKAKKTGKK
ncbi:MAG: membrane protein insertase YidC [Saprospiraceae bacterium]|jgi:YidC/Oxa1 family membrane protein insertase|nr:membrane protein insertase YidC [Saprospiraceae bacterium]